MFRLVLISTITYITTFVYAVCEPSMVTCCFSIEQTFLQLYINDEEVTHLVEPTSGFGQVNVTKTITFQEPLEQNVTIAFKGYYYQEHRQPSFAITCWSTNPDSSWNRVETVFNRSAPLDEQWRSVISTSAIHDQFPSDWYRQSLNVSSVTLLPVINSTSTARFAEFPQPQCRMWSRRVRAQRTNRYFTFRRPVVSPPSTCYK